MNRTNSGADSTEPGSPVRKMFERTEWLVWGPRLLGAICICFLACILVAGLGPFGAPPNRVTWPAGGGVYLGHRSTLISAGKFAPVQAVGDIPCSVELWVKPAVIEGAGMLFVFYAPGSNRQFSVRQSGPGLGVKNAPGDRTWPWLYVPDVFRRTTPVFITLTSDGVRTLVYIDGTLLQTAPNFPISGSDFNGRLVVASAPNIGFEWSGLMRGLAFYDHELTSAEVSRHYQSWERKGNPEATESDRAVAIYPFGKGPGPIIDDIIPSGVDLYIPDRYVVLDEVLFRPFWKEYQSNWGYYQDVLVNIFGFIPFGLAFCAYFSLKRRPTRAALLTVVFGFLISLTIETLQSVLPTRDSSTTDLINNTLGMACGVWLYRVIPWRSILAKVLELA